MNVVKRQEGILKDKYRRVMAFIMAVILVITFTIDDLYQSRVLAASICRVGSNGLDFSNREILVDCDEDSLYTSGLEEAGELEGIYLVRYESVDAAREAYNYYIENGFSSELNMSISVDETSSPTDATFTDAEEDGTEKETTEKDIEINSGDDAFSILDDMVIEDASGTIALIDTGASGENVFRSVSVIGESTADDNGHGTNMARTIYQHNSEARILSIKALDRSASGSIADIYAAIVYATKANVKVINLSVSSVKVGSSMMLNRAVSEALSHGIVVVSSAGNEGRPASCYTPGNITGIMTIGSCDEKGTRKDFSNYGAAVNYYIVSDSTSEASSIFSAYVCTGVDIVSYPDVYTREEVEDNREETGEQENTNDIETTENTNDLKQGSRTEEDDSKKGVYSEEEYLEHLKDLQASVRLRGCVTAPRGLPNSFSANVHFVQVSSVGKTFRGSFTGISGVSVGGLNISPVEVWCNCSGKNHRPGGCADPGPGEHTITASNFEFTGLSDGYAIYVNDPETVDGQSHDSGYQEIGAEVRVEVPVIHDYYVGIHKVDDTGAAVAASFDIYSNSGAGTTGGTKIGSVTTAASTGLASLDVSSFYNSGSKYFYAIERSTAANHEITLSTKQLPVHEDRISAEEYVQWLNPRSVYLTLTKSSSNSSISSNNQNYSLAGAVYKVFADRTVADNAKRTGNYSGAIGALTTSASGTTNTIEVSDYMNKNTSTGAFTNTTFYAIETAPPKNYTLDNTIRSVTVTASNVSSNPAKFVLTDAPQKGVLKIDLDKIFAGTNKVGLEGAQFQLSFYPEDITKNYTYSYLQSRTPSIKKVYTSQNKTNGKVGITINEEFPYGYIVLEEIKAPDGFKIGGGQTILDGTSTSSKMVFVISGNAAQTHNIVVSNDAIRGDIELQKYEDYTSEPIAGAQFKIKNLDTDEEAIVSTDEEGYYSTSSSYESHDGGVWFAKGIKNTEDETPDDSKGALPYGRYEITEIDAVDHQKEEPITIDITEDGKLYKIYDKGRGDGLEVISDMNMPALGTTATCEMPFGESKILPASEGQKIVDVCQYSNLRYNTEFTLIGKLMEVGEDGSVKPYLLDGGEVEAVSHFKTPDTYTVSQFDSCGEEEVVFENLDFTDKQGTSFVVFERLYLGNITREDVENDTYDKKYVDSNNDVVNFPIVHEDPQDDGQTVITPDGCTYATSDLTGSNISKADKVSLTDKIEYHGLNPEREYTIKTKVYVKPDGVLKDENGEDRVWESTFTSEKSDGFTEVKVELDLSESADKSLVFLEEVYDEDIRMFVHSDINDEAQSIHVPLIKTRARGEGGTQIAYATDDVTHFTDTIDYQNLESGNYVARGYIVDKQTGEEILLNGELIKAETHFDVVADAEGNEGNEGFDGSVDVEFSIENAEELFEGRDIVIYEELYRGDEVSEKKLVAEHKDINDTNQCLKFLKIGTSASNELDGSKLLKATGRYRVVDRVAYSNIDFEEENEYKIEGIMMDRSTGEAFIDSDGQEVVASTVFIPSKAEGTEDVSFDFATDKTDIDIVAFEKVYVKDPSSENGWTLIENHSDINYAGQTVHIAPKEKSQLPKTGDSDTLLLCITLLYLSLFGGTVVINSKSKKK